jgi:isoleucyl-tRNA synthetase
VYLDFRKDPLYTLAADHPERRSTQAVLWETLRGLTQLLAPVLSFTAEEIWQHVPALRAEADSVFASVWSEGSEPDPAALADWEQLAALREAAYRAIEVERAARRLSGTQEARVALTPSGEAERALLERYAAALPAYLQVSVVEGGGPAPAQGEAWGVAVSKTSFAKCERCWNYRATVGQSAEHPALCDRCVAALPAGFVRPVS